MFNKINCHKLVVCQRHTQGYIIIVIIVMLYLVPPFQIMMYYKMWKANAVSNIHGWHRQVHMKFIQLVWHIEQTSYEPLHTLFW